MELSHVRLGRYRTPWAQNVFLVRVYHRAPKASLRRRQGRWARIMAEMGRSYDGTKKRVLDESQTYYIDKNTSHEECQMLGREFHT